MLLAAKTALVFTSFSRKTRLERTSIVKTWSERIRPAVALAAISQLNSPVARWRSSGTGLELRSRSETFRLKIDGWPTTRRPVHCCVNQRQLRQRRWAVRVRDNVNKHCCQFKECIASLCRAERETYQLELFVSPFRKPFLNVSNIFFFSRFSRFSAVLEI